MECQKGVVRTLGDTDGDPAHLAHVLEVLRALMLIGRQGRNDQRERHLDMALLKLVQAVGRKCRLFEVSSF